MRKYIIFIIISILILAQAHKHHSFDKNSKSSHIHHPHDHSHHNHNHDHNHDINNHSNHLMDKIETIYNNYLPNIYLKVTFSIFLLSTPSFPVFLALYLFMKIFMKKNDNTIGNNLVQKMIAFAAGTLLGDLFLHMIPHLLEERENKNHILFKYFGENAIFFYIINGVIIFFLLDFCLMIFFKNEHDHSHDHSENKISQSDSETEFKSKKVTDKKEKSDSETEFKSKKITNKKEQSDSETEFKSKKVTDKEEKITQRKKEKSKEKTISEEKLKNNHKKQDGLSAMIYLFGDLIHNFTDGIAVGASFMINTKLGIITTIAITVHEIPHEIGDFAYLFKHNYSLFSILKSQILTSLGALVGGLLGVYYGDLYKIELLGLTAGGFLYLCLVNLIPEVKSDLMKNKSFINFFLNVALIYCGVIIMHYMSSFE